MKMKKSAFTKYLCALLLFGLNGIVASQIAMSSHEIVFFRTMIGSAFLIIIFLLQKKKMHLKDNKRDLAYVTVSGIAMGASWLFLYEAYQQIGVSQASLLYYCGPVIVMVLSPLLFKERLTILKGMGFLIVLLGIVFVNGQMAVGKTNLWGLFCGAVSAVMYFFMIIFNKRSRNIRGMENALIQLFISFLTVAAFVGVKQAFMIHVPTGAWPWILVLGIINTGIGCFLFFSPLSELPVQTVAVCGYLEPLSSVVFAALLLEESMSSLQIIGAVLIIGGAIFSELVPGKRIPVSVTTKGSS